MFAIGNSLKEAREKTGVSLEEASADIQIKSVIVENIEEGNIGSFKDIFELKDYLYTYAKYLGLDENKILDEFNEYMFEYTSKTVSYTHLDVYKRQQYMLLFFLL